MGVNYSRSALKKRMDPDPQKINTDPQKLCHRYTFLSKFKSGLG